MTEPFIFVGHIAIEVGAKSRLRNAARLAMAFVLSISGCGKQGICGAGARKELVLPNNFLRNKGQEFLGKLRIEITDVADDGPAHIACRDREQVGRAGPSICRPRGYIGTARPTYGQSRHRYCRCWRVDLEFWTRNQQYPPLHPLSLRGTYRSSGSIARKCSVRSGD
jgi:hypothetical protein